MEGDKPKRSKFKRYPIGFFHIDIAEVQTAEGKLYLFVGIDRTSVSTRFVLQLPISLVRRIDSPISLALARAAPSMIRHVAPNE